MILSASLSVILGLIVGSFIGSLTWRVSKGITLGGRSFCPNCRSPISWQDNIPILSYLLLSSRCRSCGRKISIRYPLVELTTGLVFGVIGVIGDVGVAGGYRVWLGDFALPFFLGIAALLIAIAVVDLEHMIIPDLFVGVGILVSILILLFFPSPTLFIHIFWATAASFSILFLNFITFGQGMGLGDVKLSVLLGLVLGEYTFLSMFVAVLLGAVVGIILILFGRTRLRQPIPFGPFLILGAFITLLFGDMMVVWLSSQGLSF